MDPDIKRIFIALVKTLPAGATGKTIREKIENHRYGSLILGIPLSEFLTLTVADILEMADSNDAP